ncbi:MAG: adenylate/guanylate cyclase domain-containing protein [Nitrosomonadales bacterium]|nr:adenylate/guanylate cyclase domain-containing protein [Nitrosomonadales bacterium]
MDIFSRPLIRITALFFALAVAETGWLHTLLPLENRLSDFFVRQQVQKLAPDPQIVIVDIDDASLARMQDVAGNWPWPRAVHGELVRGIAAQRPAAIVFDILFSERDQYRPESDRLFNEALNAADNIYFPMIRRDPALDADGAPLARIAPMLGLTRTERADPEARVALLPPLAVDPRHWRSGTINFEEDADGVGRRYRLYTDVRGWLIPSLPARVAADLGYPVPQQNDMILAWRGKAHSFRHIPYAELYEDFSREHPQHPQDEFTGKIVIIGAAATGLHDVRVTPLASLYPGMEILATALDNLKNRRMMLAAPAWFTPLLALGLLAALGVIFLCSINALRTGLVLAAVSALLLGGSYFAAGRLYLLPVLAPLLLAWACYFCCALAEYLRERRSREQAVQMFSRFVNPHVVKELIAHGGLNRAGESRQITVLFSDIRGFTTLSERHTPQEIVALLNRYFSLQVEVIFRHGGSLDKFIGDAIMAFWGAPLDDAQHARHAVAAALEMAEVLQRFRQELGDSGTGFDVGIGIHSGPAVVGLIGSEQRREYTAIGDTVNLASRIEGLTKGVSRILVSRETMELCGDAFDFQSFGSYKVKGREQEVELFAPANKGEMP